MKIVLILLFFCSTVSAQLNIRGTEYTIISNMGVESITTPRADGPDRFSDLNWEEINAGDLSSIVKAFIRDAVTHDAIIDLDDSRYMVDIVPPSNWDYRGSNVPNRLRPLGTSYDSTSAGIEIRINSWWWNNLEGIDKVLLMYHELGHASLHQDHLCEFIWTPSFVDSNTGLTRRIGVSAIMAACESSDQEENPNYVGNLVGLLDHFFEAGVYLPNSRQFSSKSRREID